MARAVALGVLLTEFLFGTRRSAAFRGGGSDVNYRVSYRASPVVDFDQRKQSEAAAPRPLSVGFILRVSIQY